VKFRTLDPEQRARAEALRAARAALAWPQRAEPGDVVLAAYYVLTGEKPDPMDFTVTADDEDKK
jgi:hypothetical protein